LSPVIFKMMMIPFAGRHKEIARKLGFNLGGGFSKNIANGSMRQDRWEKFKSLYKSETKRDCLPRVPADSQAKAVLQTVLTEDLIKELDKRGVAP